VSSYNSSYVEHSNGSYFLTDGSRAMIGNISMSNNYYINHLLDPSQDQDAATKAFVDATNTSMKGYVDAGLPYVAEGNETLVLTSNDTYVLTNNDTYVKNPLYGHLTLMAGSAMITTTLPGDMNQWETSTNKNNFIYLNFSDEGTETAQWIVDFPADWNSTANVWFTPIWTAQDGSGTVHWNISGKLFANDDALDTALTAIGDSTDTLITIGDLHIAPDTEGAAISPVDSGGNTAIIKVVRSSDDDTLSGTAQLIGLRTKYVRSFA